MLTIEIYKKNFPIHIGIIGYGIVGQAVAYSFTRPSIKKNYRVLLYDKYQHTLSLQEIVGESEFIFVYLPTPMKSDESGIDLSIVEDVVSDVTPYTDGTDKIIIIKSTVVPGTTTSLGKKYPKTKFAFSPEFLAETRHLYDAVHPDRVIVGAHDGKVLQRVGGSFQKKISRSSTIQNEPYCRRNG